MYIGGWVVRKPSLVVEEQSGVACQNCVDCPGWEARLAHFQQTGS